jgi:ATP-dependent exoDNAse (exonuclease V) alpha subunit
MATFHLNVTTIGRSKGHSAVAAAAYRAGFLGEPLRDAETGKIHHFKNKKDVLSSRIYLPKGAPISMFNRSVLWNTATTAEKRVNSTLAREFEFGLPCEVDDEARQKLIDQIANEIVDRHGCAIDANQHLPPPRMTRQNSALTDKLVVSKNWHVHLLTTTRILSADGFGAKIRKLDCKGSGEIQYWRKRICELINQTYFEAGLSIRVDHRSNKERGIIQAPQWHHGAVVSQLIREGRSDDSNVLARKRRQAIQDEQDLKVTKEYQALLREIECDKQQLQELTDKLVELKLNAPQEFKDERLIATSADTMDLAVGVELQQESVLAADLVLTSVLPTDHDDPDSYRTSEEGSARISRPCG